MKMLKNQTITIMIKYLMTKNQMESLQKTNYSQTYQYLSLFDEDYCQDKYHQQQKTDPKAQPWPFGKACHNLGELQ